MVTHIVWKKIVCGPSASRTYADVRYDRRLTNRMASPQLCPVCVSQLGSGTQTLAWIRFVSRTPVFFPLVQPDNAQHSGWN
jgi:hypothetical protein